MTGRILQSCGPLSLQGHAVSEGTGSSACMVHACRAGARDSPMREGALGAARDVHCWVRLEGGHFRREPVATAYHKFCVQRG